MMHSSRIDSERYRIFVGAFPEGELAERIQSLRIAYDPRTAAITPPHVTLAGTYWRTGAATPENEAATVQALRGAAATTSRFDLVLGGIRSFGRRVVYLDVVETQGLLAARAALLAVLGRDKHRSFRPHLTLAMRLKPADVSRMLAELRQSEWHRGRWQVSIHTLQLMQRGPEDPAWRTLSRIPLPGASPPT